MKDTVIFDLDGTLALIGHRKHFVECDKKDQNWDAFYEACDLDAPNCQVINVAKMIAGSRIQDAWGGHNYDLLIYSGRSEVVRKKTEYWLRWNDITYKELKMRPAGDCTPDDVLKKGWAEERGIDRIAMVFDDRDKVVKMWRSLGLTCMQVAPGDF